MDNGTLLQTTVERQGKLLDAVCNSLRSLEAVHASFLKQDAAVIAQFNALENWIQAQKEWMRTMQGTVEKLQSEVTKLSSKIANLKMREDA